MRDRHFDQDKDMVENIQQLLEQQDAPPATSQHGLPAGGRLNQPVVSSGEDVDPIFGDEPFFGNEDAMAGDDLIMDDGTQGDAFVDVPEPYGTNLTGPRFGGPTGGDLFGGGGGPAIGETHPADDATADHYGSPEETLELIEHEIAAENTRILREQT